GRVGLQDHPLDAAAVDEVVDVAAAPGERQRLVDVVDGEVEGAGAGDVDVDAQLGSVLLAVGAHVLQQLVLRGHAEQLVAGGGERVVALPAQILEVEVEATAAAELEHGRRGEGEDHGVLDLHQGAHGAAGD